MFGSRRESMMTSHSLGQVTDCPICLETMKTPKSLPCMHTFCLECIQSYGRDECEGDELLCPVCRQRFVIPRGGLVKLPTNFLLQELVERVLSSARSSAAQGGSRDRKMCDMCEGDDHDVRSSTASKYCVECGQYMCERCARTHSRGRYAQGHQVVSSEDDKVIQVLMKNRVPFCEKHTDKPLELYCHVCKKPICLMCRILDHRSHSCVALKQASETFIGEINKLIPDLVHCMKVSQDKKKDLDRDQQNLLKEVTATEQSISTAYTALFEVIKKQRDELLDKLNAFKNECLKEIYIRKEEADRQSVIIESFKMYFEELIEHRSAYDISRSADDVLARAELLVKSQEEFDADKQKKYHVTFTAANIQDITSGRTQLIGSITCTDFNTKFEEGNAAGNTSSAKSTSKKFFSIVNCPICMDTPMMPKVLPCRHTFCLKCLVDYGEDEIEGDELLCPICRKPFVIPPGGLEKLPNND